MKKILVIFLISLIANVSSAQSGWGYVNYTSYKLFGGNGSTNQYQAFPYSATEFDNMLNTSNSNTTITHTGEVTLATMCNGSTGTPHWGGDFYAIKFEFWFVPQETGSYSFGVNSDDASDLSVDGTIVTTYYGGHGAGGYRYGSINLVAGTRYKVIARYQEYGGGDVLYVRWSRPSSPYTYSYWTNEVTNIASNPSKKAIVNFDFGPTLDETKFSASALALNSSGKVDITNALDSNKIGNGYKATITPGQVEWSYTNPNASWLNGNSRLLIDMRQVGSIDPTKIKTAKIFDAYDSTITYTSHDQNGWAIYTVPSPLTKITDGTSTSNSYIRDVNNWHTDYAFQSTVTITEMQAYKPQTIKISTTNTLSTLYNSILTVSDVYLAFKELANGGLFGNQTGNEFTYGVQYKNADVNDDGYFNESDCFALLQHLTGVKNIVDTFTLKKTLKLIPQTTYNSIGKSNWNTFSSYLNDSLLLDINTGKAIDTFNISATWKGDVNLSHSATPASNGITTASVRAMSTSVSNEINASILTEIVGDSIYAYITLDPLSQNVVGTQFQLNYDNSVLKFNGVKFTTRGFPTNYATDKGSYINLGSLVSDGSTSLDKTTEYRVSFVANTKLTNVLGLISIGATDAVNQSGTQLKIRVN
jgi:hypothetical protein